MGSGFAQEELALPAKAIAADAGLSRPSAVTVQRKTRRSAAAVADGFLVLGGTTALRAAADSTVFARDALLLSSS